MSFVGKTATWSPDSYLTTRNEETKTVSHEAYTWDAREADEPDLGARYIQLQMHEMSATAFVEPAVDGDWGQERVLRIKRSETEKREV